MGRKNNAVSLLPPELACITLPYCLMSNQQKTCKTRAARRRSSLLVYLMLISAMALWGATWSAGRVLGRSLHPVNSAFLRFAIASVAMLLMCRVIDGRFPRLKGRQFFAMFFLGATGIFAYSLFFFTGLQAIQSNRAALIVACTPVCIAIVSAIFMKEKIGVLGILGALLSFSGVAVVISSGNPFDLMRGGIQRGDLMILGCVVSWTTYSLAGKLVMKTMSPLHAVTWSCIFGTFMLLPCAIRWDLAGEIVDARGFDWLLILYLAIFATAIGYYWYYKAIRVLGPSRSGIFINTVPLFAVVFGVACLDEGLHPSLLAGGAMVIVGVYLNNRGRATRSG